MTKYLIIGDIAGRFDEFIELITKTSPCDKIIAVGDLIDRGPKSKEVIEWFMTQPNAVSLFANHECMLLDCIQDTGIYGETSWSGSHPWLYNGGRKTLESFDCTVMNFPKDVIKWIEHLPYSTTIECKDSKPILISHSFIAPGKTLREVSTRRIDNTYFPTNILWNRHKPERKKEYSLQICGHNSQYGLMWFDDKDGMVGLCIDSSRDKILTGIVLDTNLPLAKENIKIYQVEYKS